MQTGNIPDQPPKYTLAHQILKWAEAYIVQPDGENAGKPWRFTPEQIRFLAHWYAVDENGRWCCSSGALRRSKGWLMAQVAAPRSPLRHRVHWPLQVLSLGACWSASGQAGFHAP